MKIHLAVLITIYTSTSLLKAMEEKDSNTPYTVEEICENLHHCACSKDYNCYNDFKEHLLKYYDSAQKIFFCPLWYNCDVRADSLEMLFLHLPVHTGETIDVCSGCYLTVGSKEHFKLHDDYAKEFALLTAQEKKITRDLDGYMECPECNDDFKQLRRLLKHVHDEHFELVEKISNPGLKQKLELIVITPEDIRTIREKLLASKQSSQTSTSSQGSSGNFYLSEIRALPDSQDRPITQPKSAENNSNLSMLNELLKRKHKEQKKKSKLDKIQKRSKKD